MASADMEEDLTCSICLVIYTDPVTLNCGHNFCRECIKKHLDTKEINNEEYHCPRCRKRFRGRPSLRKNTDLCNLAEKVKSSADQNRKCPKHKRILEFYCTEDSTCICVLCMVKGEHRGHEVETLEVASEKKKTKLSNDRQILTAEREKIERRAQDLYQRKKMAAKHTAELKKKVKTLFKDIRKCLKELENRVRIELTRQAEQKSISNLICKVELENLKLSTKLWHMQNLSTADPITLLQDQESYGPPEEDLGLPGNEECEPDDFIISMMLQKGLSDIEKMRNDLLPVLPQGTNITLDIKTAADDVEISDDRKSSMSTDVIQKRPNTANRFTNGVVLSKCKFSSGKHYWVVEGSSSGIWSVGVCYPSMKKTFKWIGQDSESWAIMWSTDSYGVWHDEKHKMCQANSSNKLLVYLDYEGGRLSFYELSDPLRLLHTFTEPLHAVFQVDKYIVNNAHSKITVI